MSSRIYPVAVVVFWLATTSWLVITKVVPALREGDPPNHHAAILASLNDGAPVIWKMRWNSHQVGWAATKVVKQAAGQNEIHNRIQFTGWPEGETNSPYLLVQASELTGNAGLQITNRTVLDAQNRLLFLDSKITTDDGIHASPIIKIRGDVRDNQLVLTYWLGSFQSGTHAIPLRPQSMIANEVSPRGYMPPLRLHQEWTTYQVSAVPSRQQQPVVAKVERYDPITWNGEEVEAMLVVYRRDRGTGSRAAEDYLGRMWVRPKDGMVLRQEVIILGSHLKFIRGTPQETETLAAALTKDWLAPGDKVLEERALQPSGRLAPQ